MDSQRIRPSLSDLANLDLDAPAFPEWETNGAPAVSVSRTRPPKILSTSIPPPVPTIPQPPPVASTSSTKPPSKPKSRFALQREKEAQEQAEGLPDRFELDLEGDGGALPKATPRPSLVKDILERPSNRTSPPKPPTAPRPTPHNSTAGRGFPPIGTGVFPRKFDPQPALPGPAFVEPTISGPSPSPFEADEYIEGGSVDGLLNLVSKENENLLKGMSEVQILDEQRQVREEMGLSEGVIRMLEERAKKKRSQQETGQTSNKPTPRSRPNPPSAPLPRPTPPQVDLEDEEEGTPEYIRRHFFPNEPANPALDWMKPPLPLSTGTPSQSSELAIIAFDLQGNLITDYLLSGATPPAGSDHHVSSSSTFTIPSLLALTASSVPSQRSTAFTTLLRILSHANDHSQRIGQKEWIALRNQCAQKAGWALRDPNRGVVMASIALLSHLFSSELSSPPSTTTPKLENAEPPKTLLSSFEQSDPFPSLSIQLSLSTLPRSSLVQILHLLEFHLELSRLVSSPTSIDLVLSTPKLLESLIEQFVAVPWPSSTVEDSLPCPRALEYVSNLARSSKSRAKLIWEKKLGDPGMRYLAVPPWELEPEEEQNKLGYDMFERVVELWAVLARYGIGCEMRTRSSLLLEGVFERISEVCQGKEEGELGWIRGLFELMRVWTVAGIDPHVTEHDIVWSQVEGWCEIAMEVYRWSREKGDKEIMTSCFELLSSWLEGSKVNQSWRGEKEREWIKDRFGHEFEQEQGGRVIEWVRESIEILGTGRGTKQDARFVASTLRLSQAYEETSNPPTPALFNLDSTLVQPTIDHLLPFASTIPDYIQLILLPLPSLSPSDRFTRIISILPLLEASDAVAARDLIDQFLSFVSSPSSDSHPLISSLHPTLELPSLVNSQLLRPFYLHAIVTSSGGKVIGPAFPTPRDLELTSSLLAPSSSSRLLSTNWTLSSVLDELLRSGTSQVIQNLPKGWDSSELELVKTSLVLSRITSSVTGMRIGASEMCYDLIKVFMLEKQDNQPPTHSHSSCSTTSTETDLFRHASVTHSLSQLLKPYTLSQLAPNNPPSSSTTLEQISEKVSTAPFYQLYTDFLSIYDSSSFGTHLAFSQLILVPTSTRYPVDYRRLLWTDYGHLLKVLDIDIEDAVCEGGVGVEEYFEGEVEEEEEEEEVMLRAYFEGLRNGLLKRAEGGLGLLGTVAVERLSRAVFKEGEGKGEMGKGEKVREKLIRSLLVNENQEVGRGVLRWSRGGKELEREEKERRVAVLMRFAGEGTKREDFSSYFV